MSQPQQTKRFCGLAVTWRTLAAVLGFAALMLTATIGSASAAAAARPTSSASAPNAAYQQKLAHGKSSEVHDPRWLSLKLAYRITTPGGLSAQVGINPMNSVVPDVCVPSCSPPPLSKTLSTSVVQNTLEPYGNVPGNDSACVNDDNGYCYIDRYYWSFCGPGAVDSALYYWNGKTNTYPAGSYTEPSYANYRRTTYWTSSDHNRSYLMYIAESTLVPGWSTAGMVTFSSYPNAGTYLSDITNTLNWEASGHNTSNWSNYWYTSVSNSGLTTSTLDGDITTDIGSFGYPVVAEVNTTNLPNWNHNGIIHYITIIGYNNTNHTYTYVDSCGTACGSMGSGVHTINQSTPDQYGNDLLDAIKNVGSGGGFSW